MAERTVSSNWRTVALPIRPSTRMDRIQFRRSATTSMAMASPDRSGGTAPYSACAQPAEVAGSIEHGILGRRRPSGDNTLMYASSGGLLRLDGTLPRLTSRARPAFYSGDSLVAHAGPQRLMSAPPGAPVSTGLEARHNLTTALHHWCPATPILRRACARGTGHGKRS